VFVLRGDGAAGCQQYGDAERLNNSSWRLHFASCGFGLRTLKRWVASLLETLGAF
jgi:hypothetical protein